MGGAACGKYLFPVATDESLLNHEEDKAFSNRNQCSSFRRTENSRRFDGSGIVDDVVDPWTWVWEETGGKQKSQTALKFILTNAFCFSCGRFAPNIHVGVP